MLNPILFTERPEHDFLRYQLTAYPFEDKNSESSKAHAKFIPKAGAVESDEQEEERDEPEVPQ